MFGGANSSKRHPIANEEAPLRGGVRSLHTLSESALTLSGGQQQRLCHPIATARIENRIHELRRNFTIVIVTHSMQQAARVSDMTAFFHLGVLVEVGSTTEIFTNPRDARTHDYVTGRIG